MVRIMVVDDQRLIRYSFKRYLNAVDGFEVTAEADSGEAAREIARRQEFDVILMDLNMPGIGGLEATRRLLAANPKVKIIGLSMYVDGPYPAKFMELGGAGYVSKDASWIDMIEAVHSVCRGDFYISADVAQRIVAQDLVPGQRTGISDLTRREIEVLHLISEGRTVGEIAGVLSLSPKTVTHHRRRLLEKLKAINDVQLSMIARNNGLTDMGVLLANIYVGETSG